MKTSSDPFSGSVMYTPPGPTNAVEPVPLSMLSWSYYLYAYWPKGGNGPAIGTSGPKGTGAKLAYFSDSPGNNFQPVSREPQWVHVFTAQDQKSYTQNVPTFPRPGSQLYKWETNTF